MSLEGKVVVITGASAGVGRATARELAARGAHVGLIARGAERPRGRRRGGRGAGGARLRRARRRRRRRAGRARPPRGSRPSSARSTCGSTTRWPPVFAPVNDTTPEDFRRVTEVTYLGFVHGTLAALRRMRPRDRGAIVQVGSALALPRHPAAGRLLRRQARASTASCDSLRAELLHDSRTCSVALVQLPGAEHAAVRLGAHAAAPATRSRCRRSTSPRSPRARSPGPPSTRARALGRPADRLHDPRRASSPPGSWTATWRGRTSRPSRPTQPIDPATRATTSYAPPPGDPGAHGHFDDQAKARSPQLWLATHKRALAGAAAGAAAWEPPRAARRSALRMRTDADQRPVVEERHRLLPRRRDVLDADGDGCGDLAGLTERLDYLAGLGVTCLWLMPFYPTPNRDDGYDITDYYGVDPRLGDARRLRRARSATPRDRGMRVIVDLVVNHTSDQHPWFQAARARPDSPLPRLLRLARRPARREAGTSFPDRRNGPGTSTRPAQYYHHQLLPLPARPEHRQPRRPRRDRQDRRLLAALGVSGFRLDAVPFLVEEVERAGVRPRRRQALAARAARVRDAPARRGHADGRGERRRWTTSSPSSRTTATRCTCSSASSINQRLWLALARGDAAPLEDLHPPAAGAAPTPAGRPSCATTTS